MVGDSSNSTTPSLVRSTAVDTLPDEVTVKLEMNPAVLDLPPNDRLVLCNNYSNVFIIHVCF